jgi:hypothetical protein
MTDGPDKQDPGARGPVRSAAAPAPAPGRTERRARAALDALRTLLRDLYADRFGAAPAALEELALTLRLTSAPASNWALAFDPPVAEQLGHQFDDAQAALDVFRRGRVYCFRCETSACTHAWPVSPLSVFAGYDAAGRPGWSELAQALVVQRDPRVDQLFAERPRVVAALQLGSVLRGEQLAAFGRSSKTYAVLAQAVAGYFAAPPAPDADPSPPVRLAVTVQLAEARGGGGRVRLHLNVLAGLPGGGGVEDLLATGWEPALGRAVDVARRAVDAMELQVDALRGAGRMEEARAVLQRVPQVLRRFCENVERGDRQGQRRTRHAEERRQEQRPVHKASDDARSVTAERLFFDERAQTFMVCGGKHRTHAFNRAGRHVTSFVLPPAGWEQRVRSRRWRPVSPEEFALFRAALAPAAAPAAEA